MNHRAKNNCIKHLSFEDINNIVKTDDYIVGQDLTEDDEQVNIVKKTKEKYNI